VIVTVRRASGCAVALRINRFLTRMVLSLACRHRARIPRWTSPSVRGDLFTTCPGRRRDAFWYQGRRM